MFYTLPHLKELLFQPHIVSIPIITSTANLPICSTHQITFRVLSVGAGGLSDIIDVNSSNLRSFRSVIDDDMTLLALG